MSWENCDGTPKVVDNHGLWTGKGVVCLPDLEVPSGLYEKEAKDQGQVTRWILFFTSGDFSAPDVFASSLRFFVSLLR